MYGNVFLAPNGKSVALPELKSNLFLKASSVLRNGQFSPDGKWVAYASNETDKGEIYVTSFPGAQGKWPASTGEENNPDGEATARSCSTFPRMPK